MSYSDEWTYWSPRICFSLQPQLKIRLRINWLSQREWGYLAAFKLRVGYYFFIDIQNGRSKFCSHAVASRVELDFLFREKWILVQLQQEKDLWSTQISRHYLSQSIYIEMKRQILWNNEFSTGHVFVEFRETMLTAILIRCSYMYTAATFSKSSKMCMWLSCRVRLKLITQIR